MKILKNPRKVEVREEERDKGKFINKMKRKYGKWSLTITCDCHAELEICLSDLRCHTYESDCLSADPLYAAIVCPVCHESSRLTGKIPDELERLIVLTKKPRSTADIADYYD